MLKHLKDRYGYNCFREFQQQIIEDVINKENTIVIFPTGGGKSLCYQFPATFMGKISIVISPLISLMEDQQLYLDKNGIKALCLNSNSDCLVNKSYLNKSKSKNDLSKYSVIYITPEYFSSNRDVFNDIKSDVCLFAIDEVHCMSSWGNDFRPSYKNLSIIPREFPMIPIMLLTATAPPLVLEDIFNIMNIESANQYSLGSKRENISIEIRDKTDSIIDDLSMIDKNESTIIYTQTRKEAECISDILNKYGFISNFYHAGLSVLMRTKIHEDFSKDKIKLLVATICFGMGINKPDIRMVINYGAPCDLETYYQEFGRAGRDGIESRSILLTSEKDFYINSLLFSKSSDKKHRMNLLNTFRKYIDNKTICRQYMIECYFETGNIPSYEEGTFKCDKCDKCDNCIRQKEGEKSLTLLDMTEPSKIVLDFVLSLSFNIGLNKIVDILRGSKSKSIVRFVSNLYYGKGQKYSKDFLSQVVNTLIQKNYLERTVYEKYMVLKIGNNKLKDGEKILGVENNIAVPEKTIRGSFRKEIREKISKENNIAPYVIINDKVLENIDKVNPTTLEELMLVDGVNMTFISNYGEMFLSKPSSRVNTNEVSYDLYKSGKTIEQIAKIRNFTKETIERHIVSIYKENHFLIDEKRAQITEEVRNKIKEAVLIVGKDKLRPIKDIVGNDISYFQIHICLIEIK